MAAEGVVQQRGTNEGVANKKLWAILLAVAVVIVGIVAFNKVQEQRAQDHLSDEYYCTLSGVGLYDRAPNTGKLCVDL